MTQNLMLALILCFSISAVAQGTKRGPASKSGNRNPSQSATNSASANTSSTSANATSGSEASELEAMLAAPEPTPTPAVEKAPVATAPSKSDGLAQKTKNDEISAERRAAQLRNVLVDPFNQGWRPRDFQRAFGFSSGLTGSGNAIVIENTPDAETSLGFHFGFSKLTDTYTESNTTSVSGVGTTTSTTSLSRSGAKRAATLSLGTTYMSRIYKNDFILVRWGGFGGID